MTEEFISSTPSHIDTESINNTLITLKEITKSSSNFLFSLFMKSMGNTSLIFGALLFCFSSLGLNELNQIEPINNSEEYISLFNSVIFTGIIGSVSSAIGVLCLKTSKESVFTTNEEVTSQ